jgi:GNAT superfamily N-acetyltransferase
VTVTIRTVDTSDEELLLAWWEVGRAATAERPVDTWPVWEISRTALPMPRTDGRLVLWVAEDAGEVVGSAMLFLFRHDNTHLGQIDVWVHPDHRRRGAGRRLLAEGEAFARSQGRTTLVSSAYAPVDADSPGALFAAAMGYPLANGELIKVLDLASAPTAWPELERKVAEVLDGYRVEVWENRVPEAWVPDFCALLESFLGEVPSGDLELEDASWDEARLREGEDRAIAVGRVQLIAAAVAPDGHLCGFSDLGINRHDPRHASVGGTMVLPGHRGHRLGLAMKLGTHRRIVELFPECEYVETGNAGVNAAMNAVNTQLGYRSVERCLDVQKRL